MTLDQAPVARTPAKPRRFLTLHQVLERVSLSRSTVLRMQARGKFPHAHKVAAYAVRWLESDIEEFMSACIAGREWEPSGKVRSLSR